MTKNLTIKKLSYRETSGWEYLMSQIPEERYAQSRWCEKRQTLLTPYNLRFSLTLVD